MKYKQKFPFTEVSEVIEANVKMPIDEFLKDVRFPYIKNMQDAVDFAMKFASDNPNGNIWCVGDYDVDGLVATSLIYWGFQKLGRNINLRIPHRMSEGYGLSEKIIDEIDDGLIITVDNGIAAIPAIKKAKEKGLYVIVTDHHLPSVDEHGNVVLPPADIIVDPHIDTESEYKDFCGAALAYFFVKKMFPDAELKPLLSLASIATVADMMPLIGANRTLVKDGLLCINKGITVPGLNEIISMKNLSVITEEDYGFLIGPAFNAPGRLYDSGGDKVLSVLNSKISNPALPWQVQELFDINEMRKKIVKDGVVIAESLITDERPIVIFHPSFGEGIVGIIAGQLTEKYGTPSIVFTETHNGLYKGSARSTENIHLKNALDKMKYTMIGYGGHAGAAGVTVSPDKFEEFKKTFVECVGTEDRRSDEMFYDLDITENDIPFMVRELQTYAPYGVGNPKPCFHITLDISKGSFSVMGDGSHFSVDMGSFKLLGFGKTQQYNDYGKPSKIECICNLSMDYSYGRSVIRAEIMDFMPA